MNHRALLGLLLGAAWLSTTSTAAQQPTPQIPSPPAPAVRQADVPGPSPAMPGAKDDAISVRNQLQQLLREHPPNLRRVLQLDPALLNRDYLAPYPRLVEFLERHPEIARTPAFYLGEPVDEQTRAREESLELFAGVLAGLGVFIGVMAVLAIFASLARQVIEYRRWLRQSRVQAEIQAKIFDRLTANADLLAYVQTPAARRFLEGTPPADADLRSASAPLGRILWSVQLGVVLGTLGVGLGIVQRNMSIPQEVAPAFYVLSVVAVALGAGAVLSAVIAYALSARLGLLSPPAGSHDA